MILSIANEYQDAEPVQVGLELSLGVGERFIHKPGQHRVDGEWEGFEIADCLRLNRHRLEIVG